MSIVDKFADALKKKLHAEGYYRWASAVSSTDGEPGDYAWPSVEIDWDALNNAIDEFAAEFQKQRL